MNIRMKSFGLSLRSTKPFRGPCRIICEANTSKAMSFAADAPRKRRVRRRDNDQSKRPMPTDLEKKMKKAVLEEEAKWSGPSLEELQGKNPEPLLGTLLEALAHTLVSSNVYSSTILSKIFDEKFPASKPVVDFLEFRLLEIEGKGVSKVREVFLDLGYKEESRFITEGQAQPIRSTVLMPPTHERLPKIVLSYLKADEDLSERCQEIIKKRMSAYLALAEKYETLALGVGGAPWDYPNKEEFEAVEEESPFAAWCLIHGFTPSCMAMSVNGMRNAVYKFATNPNMMKMSDIYDAIFQEHPINPCSSDPIWTDKEKKMSVVAPVAGVRQMCLIDGTVAPVPGSSVVFIERSVLPEFESLKDEDTFSGYTEDHLDHMINSEMMEYIHGCIDTAIVVEAETDALHEAAINRAKQDGKVLTLDGSNEDDEELYKQYFSEVLEERNAAIQRGDLAV